MQRMACQIQEIKLAGTDTETDVMTFEGYGAVFGNVDSYGDVIEPGAFADTLANTRKTGLWPSMLSQHGGWGMGADDMMPVGVWTDLAEDGHGLKVKGRLADTERGLEAYKLMKMEPRSAINGLSIGYIPKEWENRTKPDDPRRKLKKIELIEISLVTFPANPKARISSVKSIPDIESITDVEGILRDVGLSQREAKTLIAKIKALSPRDVDSDELAELVFAIKRNTNSIRGIKS